MRPMPELMDPPVDCDVAVVGAGIVGLAVARELARRHDGLRVAVLEQGEAIAGHQTSHSSGVIHTGIYYRPGSLKARLCVSGASELYAYCERRGIPAKRTGKLLVASSEEEIPELDELERRGRENGVRGLTRVDAQGIWQLEPHAVGIAGLHSPATGVVDFGLVADAFAADVGARGGTVSTACGVRAITESHGRARLDHSQGRTRARRTVVCAGAWTDRLAVAAGAPQEPRIVPFRGGYLRLRREWSGLVRGSIYPVPDPRLPFLGAHLTRTVDGDVLLGPTALMVAARDAYRVSRWSAQDARETLVWPGTRRLIRRHWRTGLRELRQTASRRAYVDEARRLVPELTSRDFVPGPAGVRAQAVARDGTLIDDFVVSQTERAVYVRNAPSPAATAALPLARLIADRVDALG